MTPAIHCRIKLATVMDCIEEDTARTVADLRDLKALIDSAAVHAAACDAAVAAEMMGHVIGMRKLFASYCRARAAQRIEAAAEKIRAIAN